MTKRKASFNAVDAIIIVLMIAMALGVYFVFFRNTGRGDEDADAVNVRLRYVIQVVDLPEEYADNIKENETITEYESGAFLGRVVAIDHENAVYVGYDRVNGNQVLSPREGCVDLYITVECDAVLAGNQYRTGGSAVYIGKRISMMMPELFAGGECISMEVLP